MKALLLDTETTGIGEGHHAIEVAICLYDLELGVPLSSFASLIRSATNEAEHINRIPVAALGTAPGPAAVWSAVLPYALQSDVIVAHRAEFDRGFVPRELAELRPWICSKFDVEFGEEHGVGPGLVHLALSLGLGVASAHRAMTDVDTMARIFTRAREMGHSLPDMITRAQRPKARFQALVSYDDRELAKRAGFEWDPEKKTWERTMFEDRAAELTFKTRKVG